MGFPHCMRAGPDKRPMSPGVLLDSRQIAEARIERLEGEFRGTGRLTGNMYRTPFCAGNRVGDGLATIRPELGNMNPHWPSVSALDSLEKSQKSLKIKDGGCGSFDNSL